MTTILLDRDGALYDDAHSHADDYSPSGSDQALKKGFAQSDPSAAPSAAQSPASGSEAPAPVVPYRIWAMACPFRENGSPVIGSFGASVKGVVLIESDTWTRLCDDFPALASASFEVGEFVEAGR